MKQLQHTFETSATLETYVWNMLFQRNISLLFGRMEDRRRVEFTGVELAGSAEIVAPVEKAMEGHSGGERGPGGRSTGRCS
jgi:hypothetical protein